MSANNRLVEVRQHVLKKNDVAAHALRERFHAAGTYVVSLVSSPGAGKTAFLEKLLGLLRDHYRVAALVGDLATDNDAQRLARAQVVVDTRRMIRVIAEESAQGVPAALIARRFHSTLVELIVALCIRLRQITRIGTTLLSGGVFLNALLTCEVSARLREEGFRVYRHRLVPPTDGGLSLGQLAVASAHLDGIARRGTFHPSPSRLRSDPAK